MNANQNINTNYSSLGPADVLASVGNRDNLFSPAPAAVARIGTSSVFNYRASSGGGPKCWWSQKIVTESTACVSPSSAIANSPTTDAAIKPQHSAASTISSVPIPLLSPPLSLTSPSLPVSSLSLDSGVLQHRASSLPLTPESTPPAAQSILTQSVNGSEASFFPLQTRASSFLPSLLPKEAEVTKARALSTEVEVVDRDGLVWSGALLTSDAAKALRLSSVDTEGELVLVISVPGGEGVDVREGVEMVMDLASECLNLTRLVFVLDKFAPSLRELLHGLLFIGGTLLSSSGSTSPVQRRKTKPVVVEEEGEKWTISGEKVLVGLDL